MEMEFFHVVVQKVDTAGLILPGSTLAAGGIQRGVSHLGRVCGDRWTC